VEDEVSDDGKRNVGKNGRELKNGKCKEKQNKIKIGTSCKTQIHT
jgi:hypothetical protein